MQLLGCANLFTITFFRGKNAIALSYTSLTVEYLITVFELSDNKTIKVNGIGPIDYRELVKCFNKTTRGTGRYIPPKRNFLLYILDNFDGLGLVILVLF
jgi:hypothetical protein